MPRSEFGRELTVSAPPARAWETLIDVPVLVSWISVLEQAEEQTHLEKYTAVLLDRLGPFKLRADLAITLSDVRTEEHVTVHAEGEDRQVGSRLVVDATLDLEPAADGGTTVRVNGVYEVTGKVAAMGGGTINKKAEKIIGEFFANAEKVLGAA
ncbi:CoxG family protein [Jiangella mangrovi]|uniref:Carbon monoxide dehydrogenase subunit G n=1 Tax=Jiangella mangrovi TaxID=1524084 RepID=A0A7W9LK76_9ACTN|nr:SRPBCC domain-containing protein [Jiangella mangrovi]MBB5786895.1 carbon monoxide dehydrogenase subunit G [Jiangella mangrovi]